MFKAIIECLNGQAGEFRYHGKATSATDSKTCHNGYVSEKMVYHDRPIKRTAEDIAADIVSTLYNAEKPGHDLQKSLDGIVHEAGGWKESIARAVLAALEATLRAGKAMAPALQQAYNKAVDEAIKIKKFADGHPVLTGIFCTVVALGILCLLWPAVINALGFGELGPVEGSFAAAWQSTYGGRVPYGSLFSYLQRLGMTWK